MALVRPLLARLRLALALALGLVALGPLFALEGQALLEVRPLSARVHDDADVLSPNEESALVAELAAFERETRHQIVVLTVKSLEGEAIESFALRVAEAWRIGQAELDNGVVVVVAVEDRRARIEVGYGLEGAIPDALAARILREQMIPRFRAGAMGDGIRAAVEALMAAAKGEVVPPAPADAASRGRGRGLDATAHAVLIATLIGVFLGGQLGRRRRALAPVSSGLIAALVSWLFTLLLPAALFAAIAAAVLSLFWSVGGTGRGLRRGGPLIFGPGGFGGGFGHGGGGFGGGFGGGGGGFGGGGASGSW